MSGAREGRKSVPISEAVSVSTRDVTVSVEGVDPAAIAGPFAVHLVKDGRRIASRFFFQPSAGAAPPAAGLEHRFGAESRLAHFDFVLPIEAVSNGRLQVEIEPRGPRPPAAAGDLPPPEPAGRPTLSVHLMLEPA